MRAEADLRDPRVIGRLAGVPSQAALAAGAAREVYRLIEEERAELGDLGPYVRPGDEP